MMIKKWYIRVDIQSDIHAPLIQLYNQDARSNIFIVTLTNNGEIVNLKDSNVITLIITKPDSAIVTVSGELLENGNVEFVLPYQSVTSIGICSCQLRIYEAEQIITSASFNYNTIADPYQGTDNSVTESSDYTSLQQTMMQLSTQLDKVITINQYFDANLETVKTLINYEPVLTEIYNNKAEARELITMVTELNNSFNTAITKYDSLQTLIPTADELLTEMNSAISDYETKITNISNLINEATAKETSLNNSIDSVTALENSLNSLIAQTDDIRTLTNNLQAQVESATAIDGAIKAKTDIIDGWIANPQQFKGEKGAKGDNGVSATHSWNGTTLTITSASGTSSADLKGTKGDTGEASRVTDTGTDAAGNTTVTFNDGTTITVAKGTDGTMSFEDLTPEQKESLRGPQGIQGERGPQGIQGATGTQGERGIAGEKGADGVSVTHSWNGTTLNITSASGTTSADLKGEKGDPGDPATNIITSVNGQIGEVQLTAEAIGLYKAVNADLQPNTQENSKYVTPKVVMNAVNENFVQKEADKGLSTNDYTNEDKAKVDAIPANPKYTDTTYDVATSEQSGLMSSVDKTKIDGIEEGANNYQHPSSHDASMITESTTKRFVTDAEKASWNAKTQIIPLTQAEYDALSPEQQNMAGVAYGITG